MSEENYGGVPVLDDIEYIPRDKKQGPTGISAPVLDDIEYSDTVMKKGAPKGVSAPILESMDTYDKSQDVRRGAPVGVSAPVLDDMDGTPIKTEKPEQLVVSDEEIIDSLNPELRAIFDNLSDEQQEKILSMRREQMGAVAPKREKTTIVLDEDNYTPPPQPKEEPPKPVETASAIVLDEEPEPPKYVPKYVDEDLEKAKREGAKKAVSSQLVSNQKDSKESLRMMLELKEQRNEQLAQKGFVVTIILAVIGIVGAVAFYMLYAGKMGLDYKDSLSSFGNVIKESALYIAIAEAGVSVLLITGIGGFKSLASFVTLVLGIIQVFPGAPMIPQHNGNTGLAGALYALSIGCTIAVFVMLSASEAVGLFFKKKK
ncbi:MAG: ABC transporter permease [Ruminococcus sp.]|nr:ABC transporter permease [Ruminococcus sp.]